MTTQEIKEAIKAKSYNDVARAMQADGFVLEDANQLFDEDVAWLRNRLGLTISVDGDGALVAMPAETR